MFTQHVKGKILTNTSEVIHPSYQFYFLFRTDLFIPKTNEESQGVELILNSTPIVNNGNILKRIAVPILVFCLVLHYTKSHV